MANKFQVKRTTVSGRTPNTTNSGNSRYIDTGELALNVPDGKLFSSNGSVHFEVGANLENLAVSSNATINRIIANGSAGLAGYVLTSNGTSVYWRDSASNIVAGVDVIFDAFTGDGSFTEYTLSTTPGDETDTMVIIDGVSQHKTAYSISGANIVFSSAPALGAQIEVSTFVPTGVAGTNTNVMFNDSGYTAGSNNFAFNKDNNTLSVDSLLLSDRANATSFTVGSAFVANSTGAFHTGIVNAASISTTGFVANATSLAPTANTILLGNTIGRFVVYANTVTASGLITGSDGANIGGTANLVDVNISGNLTVSGTTTYINTTTLNVGDSIVTLNADLGLISPSENAGLEVNRGTLSNVSFLWNETSDSWTSGNTDITGYANATISVNSAALTVGSAFIANASALVITTPVTANGGTGTSGQVLKSNGSTGSPYWDVPGATAGGSDTQIQFNDGGTSLNATAGFTFNKASNTVSISNTLSVNSGFSVNSSQLTIGTPISANGVTGTSGYVLRSNGSVGSPYWAAVTTGTVTSITTGNGLTGGPITSTGTVDVVAGDGIVSNATGVYVNTSYIATLDANNAGYLGGTVAASYVQNTDSRTLSGNLVISGTQFTPVSNTTLLGNSSARWVLSANTGDFSGTVSYTSTGTATTGGAQIYLNGSTLNRVDFNTNGTAAPAFTTRSAGTKIALYPAISGSSVDYALGVDAGALWTSIPGADGGQFFKWYGGETQVGSLSGTGMMNITGAANAASHTVGTAFIANSTAIVGTGYANISTSVNSALLTVGTAFIANTTGAHHTGTVNAASFTTSGIVANSTGILPTSNTVGASLGSSTQRWNLDANGATFSANIAMGNNYITGLSEPLNNQDAATKAYVDAFQQGLHVHEACHVATPDTLATLSGGSVTYDNGTLGVGATLTLGTALSSIDGHSLTNGDRVLVKNQSNTTHNGIYTWATGGTVLTRATDFDSGAEVAGGDFTFITNGTLYNSTGWVQVDEVTTMGTDPIVFIQFSGQGLYTAGSYLSLNGSQFNVNATSTSTASVAVARDADGSFSANTITANLVGSTASLSTSVNSALLTVGTSFIANTTGAYHTGTVNAASYTINTNYRANTTGVYHTGTVNASSFTTTALDANTSALTVTGYANVSTSVNSALLTVGTAFIANSTAIVGTGYANVATSVNSALLTVGTAFIANSTAIVGTGYANISTSVNSAALSVGTAFIANSTQVTLSGIPFSGNGTVGTAGQMLTSNGTTGSPYWSTIVTTPAASYVQNTDSRTLSGNLVISGTYFNPSANTVLLGNSISRWVVSANTGDFTGTVTGTVANMSTSVNSALLTVGTAFIANTTALVMTTPVTANGTTGTSGYVLKSNGSVGSPYWAVAGGSVGGSDTHIQFNDGGSTTNGTAGFTFTKTTNNVTIANTLTVGSSFIANSTAIIGVGYANVTGSVNASSHTVGTAFIANSTAIVGTGYANVTTSVNSALLTVGTAFIANTTGMYHTGVINAASFSVGSGSFVANTTHVIISDPLTANGTTGVARNVLVSNGTVGSPYWTDINTDVVYALTGTALDPLNGTIQTKTLAATTTFTDSLTAGQSMVLMLNGGSSFSVIFPTMVWVTTAGNVAPTLTANVALTFWKISSTLYGSYVGSYA